MDNLEEIINLHVSKYPLMLPQDVVKLLYQREFGPGHMVESGDALQYLQKEELELVPNTESLFTPIGNHLSRIDLYQAQGKYSSEEIATLFTKTASITKGSMTEFLASLKWVKRHYDLFPYAFSQDDLNAYLAYYQSLAYPSIHHSETYRHAYHPHYRVLIRQNENR